MMNFSGLIAKVVTQEIETADHLMNRMSKQDLLIAYQACIFILEHEMCQDEQIMTHKDFESFVGEYENSFVLQGDPKELAGIYATNHAIRKPILEALAQRTIEIFLGAK